MNTQRLFIAADVSDAQRENVHKLLDGLKKGMQFTKAHPKWVPLGNMHLTLKFLGDVETNNIDQIIESLNEHLSITRPFDFSLRGLGVFPNAKQPRVLWLGIDAGRQKMINMAEAIESKLAPLDFPPEKRKHHPHLTLARINSLRGASALIDVMQSHKKTFCGKAPLDHLTLYKSELRPEGAKYTALHTWPLTESDANDAS